MRIKSEVPATFLIVRWAVVNLVKAHTIILIECRVSYFLFLILIHK